MATNDVAAQETALQTDTHDSAFSELKPAEVLTIFVGHYGRLLGAPYNLTKAIGTLGERGVPAQLPTDASDQQRALFDLERQAAPINFMNAYTNEIESVRETIGTLLKLSEGDRSGRLLANELAAATVEHSKARSSFEDTIRQSPIFASFIPILQMTMQKTVSEHLVAARVKTNEQGIDI